MLMPNSQESLNQSTSLQNYVARKKSDAEDLLPLWKRQQTITSFNEEQQQLSRKGVARPTKNRMVTRAAKPSLLDIPGSPIGGETPSLPFAVSAWPLDDSLMLETSFWPGPGQSLKACCPTDFRIEASSPNLIRSMLRFGLLLRPTNTCRPCRRGLPLINPFCAEPSKRFWKAMPAERDMAFEWTMTRCSPQVSRECS